MNRICQVCNEDSAEIFCTCTSARTPLCQKCFTAHQRKYPVVVHSIFPMAAWRRAEQCRKRSRERAIDELRIPEKNVLRRLTKEYHDVPRIEGIMTRAEGVGADIVAGDLFHWKAKIKGPQGTPYENGVFVIDIKFPDDYPYKPAKMTFETPIWHPNIDPKTGEIYLDTLRGGHCPALTTEKVLLSVQALLSDPNYDEVVDFDLIGSIADFEAKAREWTRFYARDSTDEHDLSIRKLLDLGFREGEARRALQVATVGTYRDFEKVALVSQVRRQHRQHPGE